MQSQKPQLSQTAAKYNNMRLSLLIILVCSVINIFSPLLDFYMLFSAYVPQWISKLGAYLYLTEGVLVLYVLAIAMALVMLVPYLLCYIFSKKNVGWMIAALVLFSVDTLFFLIDLVGLLAIGEISFVMDLLFHAYALVSLILGVKYGLAMKNEKAPDYEALAAQAESAPVTEDASMTEGEGGAPLTRTLTLTRKKSFIGCAARVTVYVNGQAVSELKNGETATISVPVQAFALGASLSGALVSNETLVTAGDTAIAYTLSIKSGWISNTILFQEGTV